MSSCVRVLSLHSLLVGLDGVGKTTLTSHLQCNGQKVPPSTPGTLGGIQEEQGEEEEDDSSVWASEKGAGTGGVIAGSARSPREGVSVMVPQLLPRPENRCLERQARQRRAVLQHANFHLCPPSCGQARRRSVSASLFPGNRRPCQVKDLSGGRRWVDGSDPLGVHTHMQCHTCTHAEYTHAHTHSLSLSDAPARSDTDTQRPASHGPQSPQRTHTRGRGNDAVKIM